MKATELQLGDWVEYNGEKYQVTYLYSRPYPDGTNVGFSILGDFCVDVSCVNPIPLTPEILEKNGFEITPSSWEMEINDIVIVIVKKQDEYLLSISEPYCDGIAKGYKWTFHDLTISYVHQLQHSFRLCGLSGFAE